MTLIIFVSVLAAAAHTLLAPALAFSSARPSTRHKIASPTSATALRCTDDNVDVRVSTVESHAAILSLADLRYHEWMDDDFDPPRIESFRLATAEIFEERRRGGSTVFLATRSSNVGADGENGDGRVAVGAAELSPIELQGTFDGKAADVCRPLYVTDVVTSSAHRRLGIGSKLMDEVERAAFGMGSKTVYLHVKHDNVGARQFYERRGYVDVVENATSIRHESDAGDDGMIALSWADAGSISIDANRLASNAGTVGQVLMMKRLTASDIHMSEDMDLRVPTTEARTESVPVLTGGGFGMQREASKQKRKKRKR